MRASGGPLEHGDVVADPVFLVLRNALGDPGDVADFLQESSQQNAHSAAYGLSVFLTYLLSQP